ncbi:hypothetical protein J4434_01170 [Candidatus Woesearchaeota archaeon]|nr:hypothetical protein [Candidatus Woesearchaeota archaeon]
MNKRGQITIWIVLALVLLILFAITAYVQDYFFLKTKVKQIQEVPQELIPVKEFVESCIEQSAREAIVLNSIQGGYFDIRTKTSGEFPPELLSMPLTIRSKGEDIPFYIPYYIYAGEDLIPSINELEAQFPKRIKTYLLDCLNFSKLSNFNNLEIKTSPNQMELNAQFSNDSINLQLIYPLKIKIGDTTKEISFFEKEVKTTYSELFQAAKEFSETQLEHGNYICLTCMQDVADKYDLFIQHFETEDYGEIIFEKEGDVTTNINIMPNHTVSILYQFTKEDATWQNITFQFVHFFDIKDEYREKGDSLELTPIDDILQAEVGYEFSYQAEADGNNVSFFDDTLIFDIDMNTGLIKFTPQDEDVGSRIIKFGVVDNDGNVKTDTFILNIKSLINKPSIEYIDYQNAAVGEEFTYQVVAKPYSQDNIPYNQDNINSANGKLIYSDDTTLFDIDKNIGIIKFTPKESDAGEHTIKITVIDENGYLNTAEMLLIINEKYEEEGIAEGEEFASA